MKCRHPHVGATPMSRRLKPRPCQYATYQVTCNMRY